MATTYPDLAIPALINVVRPIHAFVSADAHVVDDPLLVASGRHFFGFKRAVAEPPRVVRFAIPPRRPLLSAAFD